MFLKAVFSGSWVSDPSKKEDPLKKRRLAQLPGCKPDPTNWRWLKKIAAWGRLRVQNVNGKTFGKKVVLLIPVFGKRFGFTIPLGFPSQKNSIGKGLSFTIPLGFLSPKKSIGKGLRDLVLLYLWDFYPPKNPLERD